MKNPFYRNTEFIKNKGFEFLSQLGYSEIGFEGCDEDLVYGGYVWFQAKKPKSPLIYTIQLRKQGNYLKWVYERIINPQDVVTNKIQEIL